MEFLTCLFFLEVIPIAIKKDFSETEVPQCGSAKVS